MKILKTLALAFSFFSLLLVSTPQNAFAAEDGAHVIAARFYAEWCGNCKRLDAKLEQIQAMLNNDDIENIVFDLSNKTTKKASAAKAEALGLAELYKKYKRKTGVLVLIDSATGEKLDVITHTVSADAIKQKLIDAHKLIASKQVAMLQKS